MSETDTRDALLKVIEQMRRNVAEPDDSKSRAIWSWRVDDWADELSAALARLPSSSPPEAVCEAFRAGWATGFQECAEGATIDWPKEPGERPALETLALERWLFVQAAAITYLTDRL
jgi:hypothetical protein